MASVTDGRSALPENYNRRGKEVAGVDKTNTISGPLTNIQNCASGSRAVVVNSNENEDYVDITLDVRGDSIVLESDETDGASYETDGTSYGTDDTSYETDGTVDEKEPEMALLGKSSRFGSLGPQNSSKILGENIQELKPLKGSSAKRQPINLLEKKKSAASPALKGLRFLSQSDKNVTWSAVDRRFWALTDKYKLKGLLPRELFGECIGLKKESKNRARRARRKDKQIGVTEKKIGVTEKADDFSERLFDTLCRRRHITRNKITKYELYDFWVQLSDQSFDSRLMIFFDMVDKDDDGRITEEEIKKVIELSASENKLLPLHDQAHEYARLIMEEVDPDNLGYIFIENLKMILSQEPTVIERGDFSKDLSEILGQKMEYARNKHPLRKRYDGLKHRIQDNRQRNWVIVLWMGIMAGLFTWKYIEYKHRAVYDVLGSCVCIAKGAAETLKLNMAIVLLPVCRNTITWLRNNTKLDVVVPFDENISFHKVITVAIAIGVGLHAISHLACDFPRLIHATEEEYIPMQQYFGDQAKNYWHFVKEVEGYTGIVMVLLMAIVFTLAWLRPVNFHIPKFLVKSNNTEVSQQQDYFLKKLKKLMDFLNNITGYNVFWYSHHLFVIVYALLIVHGIKLYLTKEWYKKTTWMYLAVPVTLYACERLTRALRSRIKQVEIRKVTLHPGEKDVLALHMSKPQGFKYKSGQYMFVYCASVSPFEWHPFSITSAPCDDYLSVHIRESGDWTKKLKTELSKEYSLSKNVGGKLSVDLQEGHISNLKVKIDGPYGAPAQDYKKYDVVMLLGFGIGATPIFSIAKDIICNIKVEDEKQNALENGVTLQKNKSAKEFRTKRAYIYWVTREQGSFDWFKDVMNEVGEMDKYGVIEMHNYCTNVYEEGDARSALVTMIQHLNHAKNGVDVVSGTRIKSHFARPNWPEVYKRIAVDHTGSTIGVFCCGPEIAMKDVKDEASKFSHVSSTKFKFHKENF